MNDYQVITPGQLMKVIAEGNAFAKTISSPFGFDEAWLRLLRKVTDPEGARAQNSRNRSNFDRSQVFNPKEGKWIQRDLNYSREKALKKKRFTRKTSVTLLPKDGVINLFQSADPRYRASLAIIFDSNECNLKDEKYVFDRDVNSHLDWWKKHKDIKQEKHIVHRSMPFTQLQSRLSDLRTNGEIPKHNELLVGLSKEAIMGILIVDNTLEDRLSAISKKEAIKKMLNRDVPLFIQNLQTGPIEYSQELQLADIRLAESKEGESVAFTIVTGQISMEYKEMLNGRSAENKNKKSENKLDELVHNASNVASSDARLSRNTDLIRELTCMLRELLPDSFMWKRKRSTDAEEMALFSDMINTHASIIISTLTDPAKIKWNLAQHKFYIYLISYVENVDVLTRALQILLEKKDDRLLPAIEYIMARLQTIEFPPTRKLVGYERFVKWNVYTPEIPKVEITNELTVDGWIPFTFAMLNYDPFHMAKLIVKHSPQSIPQLLRTLANLEEMLKKYTTTCTLGEHINSSCVKQCRVSLLLELTEATDYKSTDEDKRDLQSYFLSKMDATKTKTQLENVINENKDCYALKHHKRTTADSSYELLCLLKLTNSSFKVSNYYFNGEPYYFRVGFYSSSRIIDDNFDYILSFIIDTNKIRNELTQVKLFVELISDSRNVDVLVRALQILFEKNEAQHMPVIAYIMERCSNIDYSLESHLIDHTMIRIHHPYVLASKLVGHTYGQDKTYNSYMPTDVIVQTWSPLTTAMLNYDPDQMANLIIKHQQFTPTIIANLNELEEKLVNAASPTLGSHVDAAFVRKCRLALLLRLNESSAYQVTFKDKRDLELYFMNKVNCAKNQVELDSVTKEGNACYLLQQHRNPVFDTVAGLFGKSKMTKAEETIANCVEAKRKTFRVMRTPL